VLGPHARVMLSSTPSERASGPSIAPSTLSILKDRAKLNVGARELFQWALDFSPTVIHTLGLAGMWDAEMALLKDSFEAATYFHYETPPEPVAYLEQFFAQLAIVWERLRLPASSRTPSPREVAKIRPLTKERRLERTLAKFRLLDYFQAQGVGATIRMLAEKHGKDPEVGKFLRAPAALRSALRRLQTKFALAGIAPVENRS